MPVLSVVFGIALMALSVWGYWGGALGLWEPLGFAAPEKLSGTAFIPGGVGIVLLLCGVLAFKERFLKHAMHLAAMFGLIGFLAAGSRLVGTLINKGKAQGVGGVSLAAMTLLCGLFVALCINSFIQARRRRAAATPRP